MSRRMRLSIYKLMDKEVCQNPEMEKPDCKICRAEVLHVNVDDVLIRPLSHTFSAQLHVVLDQNLTLREAYEILTKINTAVSERFETEETTLIPRPG